MTGQISKKAKELLQVLDIANLVINESDIKDEKEKKDTLSFIEQTRNLTNSKNGDDKITSYGLKSLTDSFLVYWNESISVDTEKFWNLLEKEGISIKRKEPLRQALLRGVFRNVHEAMEACKNFDEMVEKGVLKSRYNEAELTTIRDIIDKNTSVRVELLRSCLIKGKIPSSKYLRFGDSMAYMGNCNLFNDYFNENEVEQLLDIWNNFK